MLNINERSWLFSDQAKAWVDLFVINQTLCKQLGKHLLESADLCETAWSLPMFLTSDKFSGEKQLAAT